MGFYPALGDPWALSHSQEKSDDFLRIDVAIGANVLEAGWRSCPHFISKLFLIPLLNWNILSLNIFNEIFDCGIQPIWFWNSLCNIILHYVSFCFMGLYLYIGIGWTIFRFVDDSESIDSFGMALSIRINKMEPDGRIDCIIPKEMIFVIKQHRIRWRKIIEQK